MINTETAPTVDTDDFCVRGGCGQRPTHLVSHYDVETDKLMWVYAVCKLHAPAFLMGHNDRVYARFVEITERWDLGNLTLAIALTAFEAMQGESFAAFRARITTDPTTPRWAA